MKKPLLTLLINLLIASTTIAQIPKEAFTLTNSMYDLWQNGQIEKAVESSLELYSLYPPFFIDNIHHSLSQQMKQNPENGIKYLEALSKENNQEINKIIAPIHLWGKSLIAKDEKSFKPIKDELQNLHCDSSDYKSKAESYCLLILAELDKNNAINKDYRQEIIEINIRNLKRYPNLNKEVHGNKEAEERAWHRYILANSYDYLFSKVNNNEEYLKKAAEYSPDLLDRLNRSAYFYDAGLLTGNIRQFGFKLKYLKYLMDNNRDKEALNILCEITFGEPTDDNIKKLQEYYSQLNESLSFKSYWTNYIHKQGKEAPKIKVDYPNEVLDLTNHSNNWVYIDVWGTWCSPCCEELPDLQSLYASNKEIQESELKIFSFSFGSQNLADFMNKNKYTFPVSEIGKKTNDAFEVTSYPTKILISPKGNYIKIPYGVNWKMYIKNYLLM